MTQKAKITLTATDPKKVDQIVAEADRFRMSRFTSSRGVGCAVTFIDSARGASIHEASLEVRNAELAWGALGVGWPYSGALGGVAHVDISPIPGR